jgi:hypothetical protein
MDRYTYYIHNIILIHVSGEKRKIKNSYVQYIDLLQPDFYDKMAFNYFN